MADLSSSLDAHIRPSAPMSSSARPRSHTAPEPASPRSPHEENDTSDEDDDHKNNHEDQESDRSIRLYEEDSDEGDTETSLEGRLAEGHGAATNLDLQEELRRLVAVERNPNTRLEYQIYLESLEEEYTKLSAKATSQTSSQRPSVSQPPDTANSSSSRKATYGSNENVYNPYDPYSSKEYIAQEVAAGRMKRSQDIESAQYGNVSSQEQSASMPHGNSLANKVPRRGETEILHCARLLLEAGEVTEENLSSIPLHGDHADIMSLAVFVDRPKLDAFMNSFYVRSDLQHPLLQYAVHRSNFISQPLLGSRQATSSSTLNQTRASAGVGVDARPYLPPAFLGASSTAAFLSASSPVAIGSETEQVSKPELGGLPRSTLSPGRVGASGSDPESISPYKQEIRSVVGRKTRRSRKTGSEQQPVQAVRAELPPSVHNPQSPIAGTFAQGSLPASLQRKRRHADVSPPENMPSLSAPEVSQARNAESSPSAMTPPLLTLGRGQAPNRGSSHNASMLIGGPRLRHLSRVRSRVTPMLTANGEGVYLPQAVVGLPDVVRSRIEHFLGLNTRTTSTQDSNTSLLPPLGLTLSPHLFFTSELLPRSFDANKRLRILNILRTKASYAIPACISTIPGKPKMEYHLDFAGQWPYDFPVILPLGPYGKGWPAKAIPLEIVEQIAGHLAREDIEQLRLVNKEIEKKVSKTLFHNVVVKFTPKIYGMLVAQVNPEEDNDLKGKRKAKGVSGDQDSATQEIHDGMETFQAWGPHVRNFAMAFEVDEEQLSNPPKKSIYKEVATFWGQYCWPHPFYNRYQSVEDLEKKADEFRCMSFALSNLRQTHKLGLSLDSGLGWLSGPDMSDRVQLFKEKPTIFGKLHQHPDAKTTERDETWKDILYSLGLDGSKYVVSGETVHDVQGQITPNRFGFHEVIVRNGSGGRYAEDNILTRPYIRFVNYSGRVATARHGLLGSLVFSGVNLAATQPLNGSTGFTIRNIDQGNNDSSFKNASLVPSNLTAAQKEWLLETEWAQRAFLSSFCMAMMDNSQTFQHVESLIIAKLSSRYLPALQREDFWKALPMLKNLTFKVSPDFRDIQKTGSGVVEAPDIEPSKAAGQFYNLLKACIAAVPSIKTMDLGYIGGGEQQTGIFGRNQHILPAPLTNLSDPSGGLAKNILVFPHVKFLTLSNCWIAPPTLKGFVAKMAAHKMHTLTLNSVSLSAHSNTTNQFEPNPLKNGTYSTANGPPLYFQPKLGDLWEQRRNVPDPNPCSNPESWMLTASRIGLWRNVIDAITPGPTVDLLRYAFNYRDEAPEMRDPGALKRIEFISCGYVKLVNQSSFQQDHLGEVIIIPPTCLQKRAMDLMPCMMHRHQDRLLGQIIPHLSEEELEVFESCFPMTIGWGDDESRLDNHEDGQAEGGSGRFSGQVEKLNPKSYE